VSYTSPSPPGTYPVWDGVPRDELGCRPIFGVDLLLALRERHPEGEGLSEILNWGTLENIRGGEVVVNQEDRVAMVRLWVPAFEDQRGSREQQAPHVPISAEIRWSMAELALGALAASLPDRVVQLGFLENDGHAYMLPWREYCRAYSHPPEFALGYWEL
jgi:hypothetical protein